MKDLKALRSRLRKCLEQLGAARMVGDAEGVGQAEEFVKAAKLELASALVKEMMDGVSKANESAGKPKVVQEGKPR